MENKKINFFSRIIRAITKFDEYEIFINEKLSVAISYIFKLILIISFIVSLVLGFSTINQMKNIIKDVSEKVPNFNFEDYKLSSDEKKEFSIEDDFYVIIDTNPELEETSIEEYKTKLNDHQIGLLVLKDKAILKRTGFDEYNYEQLLNSYNVEKVDFTKDEAIEYINTNILEIKSYLSIFAIIFVSFFIATTVSIVSDVLLLAILGFITAKISRAGLNFREIFTIAIYSITLPLVLLGLYQIALSLINFKMEYFNLMYLSIGYIYVVAAILIIKSNKMRQVAEVTKVVEAKEELKEKDEANEKKDEQEDDKENDKNPKDKEDKEKQNNEPEINTDEPNGSEI